MGTLFHWLHLPGDYQRLSGHFCVVLQYFYKAICRKANKEFVDGKRSSRIKLLNPEYQGLINSNWVAEGARNVNNYAVI